MTYQEIAAEIVRLPINERLQLLELVSRSLREDIRPTPSSPSLTARLRGIANAPGTIPDDDQIEDDYVTYLEQKYS